jgi:hypothetical protein
MVFFFKKTNIPGTRSTEGRKAEKGGKDCHVEIGAVDTHGVSTGRSGNGFFKESRDA